MKIILIFALLLTACSTSPATPAPTITPGAPIQAEPTPGALVVPIIDNSQTEWMDIPTTLDTGGPINPFNQVLSQNGFTFKVRRYIKETPSETYGPFVYVDIYQGAEDYIDTITVEIVNSDEVKVSKGSETYTQKYVDGQTINISVVEGNWILKLVKNGENWSVGCGELSC